MKEITPLMLNKEAQNTLMKADEHIDYMASIGRRPGKIGYYPNDFRKIYKAVEAAKRKEGLPQFEMSHFRYRGFEVTAISQ